MKNWETYLSHRVSFPPLIDQKPPPHLTNIVVIPCHDEDHVLDTLVSLENCSPPVNTVEGIIVINASEKDPHEIVTRNRYTFQQIKQWGAEHNPEKIKFFPLLIEDLPAKKAGVGMARKIGMDEAVRRFFYAQNPEGIITSLDADTRVGPDYLTAIEAFFLHNRKIQGASIYFEHPLSGTGFSSRVYEGIIQYELHLRYFVYALRRIHYPFAFHTVGSAFAVRVAAYVRQGGMNTRQGGEDFYFLQKIIKQGNFADLNTTRVMPSPRPGTKVPFGTGPEIQKFLTGKKKEFLTYAPEAFGELSLFFSMIPLIYTGERLPGEAYDHFPSSLKIFLEKEQFIQKIMEIRRNVSSEKTFRKRFYHSFDLFWVIKYLNESHRLYFNRKPVFVAARKILQNNGISPLPKTNQELLEYFRAIDKNT